MGQNLSAAVRATNTPARTGLSTFEAQQIAQSNGAQGIQEGNYKVGADQIGMNVILECRNIHPTVKPIALVEHLATLLLPPAAYAPRRILVPFSGSGSEVIGAWRAGWEDVQGIDDNEEYCKIARARVAYWLKHIGLQLGMFK